MNGKLIFLLVCGLLVLPAQAASFDCKKAGTKVEHIICETPDISKLDEEMASTYQARMVHSPDAKKLKQAQQSWLTQRNICLDADCVRKSYRAHIVQLRAATITSESTVASSAGGGAAQSEPIKYPPYPDIWELQSPLLQGSNARIVERMMLSNGDIWFRYSARRMQKRGGGKISSTPDYEGITFFGQQAANFKVLGDEITLSDGSKVKALEETISQGANGLAQLADGTQISSLGAEYKKGCYQGPGGNWLLRDKDNGAVKLQSKVVFLLLDKPIRISTGFVKGKERHPACETSEERVVTRVVSLGGTVLPLRDGGFLFQNLEHGVVMRFDSNINTHSILLNNTIFVVDKNEFERFYGDEMEKSEYQDAHGFIKMQALIDSLYMKLQKLKEGGGK